MHLALPIWMQRAVLQKRVKLGSGVNLLQVKFHEPPRGTLPSGCPNCSGLRGFDMYKRVNLTNERAL